MTGISILLFVVMLGSCGFAIFCPKPAVPQNGVVNLKYNGYFVQYICNPGYKVKGVSQAICIRHTWTHPAPRCVSENPDATQSPTVSATIVPLLNNDIFSQHIKRRQEEYNILINKAKRSGLWYRANQLKAKLNGIVASLVARRKQHYHNLHRRKQNKQQQGEVPTLPTRATTILPSVTTANVTDACVIDNGGCAQNCKVLHHEVTCSCNGGYMLNPKDGKSCEDVNECEPNFGRGPCSDRCTNSEGSFKCLCTRSGTELSRNNKTCQDIDECAVENNGCSHICTNVYASAFCSCPPGYILLKGGKTCEDIDECKLPSTECFGNCVNMPGSYRCAERIITTTERSSLSHDCFLRGLKRNENGYCVDINECAEDNYQCSHQCINYYGGAFCACPRGFKKINAKSCTDINECNTYIGQLCSFGCINTIGGYICACPPGFKRGYKQTCRDINECATNNGGCSHRCVNQRGSMECRCPNGFELLRDKKTCKDINECLLRNPCQQRCINFDGGYKCACNPGHLLLYNDQCEPCRKNSYMLEGKDSCNECPPHSHTDGPGKTSLADCLCNEGFEGDLADGKACTDIDECSLENFGCSDRCVNTPGGAHCSCSHGYKLDNDGKTCIDIDECSLGNGGCEHQCINKIGSFECSCKENYNQDEANPMRCIDINECDENNGGCSHHCENLIGSYQCECESNMRLSADQKTCRNIECAALPRPANSAILCDGMKKNEQSDLIVGISCSVLCNHGYERRGDEQLTCLENGIWSNDVPHCSALKCPKLAIPDNGNISPSSCQEEDTEVTQKCYFTCNKGYILVGKSARVCKRSRVWSPADTPFCRKDIPEPFIQCPADIEAILNPGENSAEVELLMPISNMNSEDIIVEPTWASKPVAVFSSAISEVTYTARNPLTNETATCIMSVVVKDQEPPTVKGCPNDFEVDGGATKKVIVHWDEPTFSDNVGIERIWKSNDPGSEFGNGIHSIKYSAQDAAGNGADCTFSVTVKRQSCPPLIGPKNGQQNCMDWLYGQICQPNCNKGYMWYNKRNSSLSKTYACGADTVWKPDPVVPDCIEYRTVDNVTICFAGEESHKAVNIHICVKCPLGMYSDAGSLCKNCPTNHYTDAVGSTFCKSCPDGFVTASSGSISSNDCTLLTEPSETSLPKEW